MYKRQLLAYLVGVPIADNFSDLPPCSSPDQMKCFLSWNTFGDNINPYNNEYYKDIVASNPVSFDESNVSTDIYNHKGILMPNIVQMFKYQVLKLPVKNFKLKKPNKISVKAESGSLQIKEINIPWIKLFNMESYDSGDYNLFWLNIRENLHYRLSNYFKSVAIRPGKPILFAKIKGKPKAVFGLPGNPISSAACFRFFVYPYIRSLLGIKEEISFKARVDS